MGDQIEAVGVKMRAGAVEERLEEAKEVEE